MLKSGREKKAGDRERECVGKKRVQIRFKGSKRFKRAEILGTEKSWGQGKRILSASGSGSVSDREGSRVQKGSIAPDGAGSKEKS
jgi:hypothetical protein